MALSARQQANLASGSVPGSSNYKGDYSAPNVDPKMAINSGYTGTAEQNSSVSGYVPTLPNQSGNNVITSDNLAPEKAVQVKPITTDTAATGMASSIASLAESTKNSVTADQAQYDKQTQELAEAMRVSGDTSAFDERVIREQGVDVAKKSRNNFLTQIEQEQKSSLDQVNELRSNWTGTTAGLNAEIARIQRDSANKLANLGIGLSAASRDYETASSIADRLITANTNKIKADIEARQFVLGQLGTRLATEKSQEFQLQIKSLEKMESNIKDAVSNATDLLKTGVIDGSTYSKIVSGLSSGTMSMSDFYQTIGQPEKANVMGYIIKDWATDPSYEAKVKANYDSMPTIFNAEDADEYIKSSVKNSPITGEMVFSASKKYGVDPKMVMAMMQQESSFGTSNVTRNNNNPTGITWSPSLERNNPGISKGTARPESEGGYYAKFDTIQDAVNFQAKWLSNNKAPATALRQLSVEDFTRLNSTPQSEAITNGEKFANALNAYRSAVEKYGSGELFSATGKGELNSSYQAVVGAIKDYYKLGTLDNGVQKLVELGIPNPGFLKRDSSVVSGIDSALGLLANEMNTNAEALALTKYANSVEGKAIIERGAKLYNSRALSQMDNETFLNSTPSSGIKTQSDNNASFYNQFKTNG